MSILERSNYQPAQARYPFQSGMPKRPIKSFQDLEVYQKSLEAAVFVGNIIIKPKLEKIIGSRKLPEKRELFGAKLGLNPRAAVFRNMLPCALGIPHLLAEAHSLRFGSGQDCLVLLEKVMMNCNKMVVYLEMVRDICETRVTTEQFEEQIKKYLYIRRKVLNLQRSWKKFIDMKR